MPLTISQYCRTYDGHIDRMSFIDCSDQPLGISFHPSTAIVAAALVDGTVEIHSYPSACSNAGSVNDEGNEDDEEDTIVASLDMMSANKNTQSDKSATSCRAIQFSLHHPSRIYAATNDMLACWDLESNDRDLLDGKLVWAIHDTKHPIQRMARSTPHAGSSQLLFTGDDHGTIRIYDTRLCTSETIADQNTPTGCILSCHQCHSDYISGLQPTADSSLLFSSSADGTWAVHDLRKMNSKSKILFQSDIMDDDELLSLFFVEEHHKVFCGTPRGVVKAWTRSGTSIKSNSLDATFVLDTSSFIYYHPPHHSIDSIISMDHDTLITGCSDGFIRFFSISSHKFIGILNPSDDVMKQHTSKDTRVHELISVGKGYPIEQLDFTLEKKFLASLSHDNFIRFYSLEDEEIDDDDDESKCPDESDSKQLTESDDASSVSIDTSSSDSECFHKLTKNKKFKTDSANFFDDL